MKKNINIFHDLYNLYGLPFLSLYSFPLTSQTLTQYTPEGTLGHSSRRLHTNRVSGAELQKIDQLFRTKNYSHAMRPV